MNRTTFQGTKRAWRAAALGLGLLLAFLGAALPAAAAPTVYGPTGLMFVPTADVLPNGGFNFALHRFGEGNFLTFNTSLMDNLEFGVTAVSWDGGHWDGGRWVDGTDARANVKFRLLPESRTSPALAVGVSDLADDHGRGAYVVLTKSLPQVGFRGTIGLNQDGLIAGLSKELNPVSISKSGKGSRPGATFLIDVDGSALNLGVGIGLTPELRANVYLYDLDTAVLGLSYQARF